VKRLVTAAILAFAAFWGTAALAQVYGTNDDPYQQNPFASNMTVPEPASAPPSPAGSSSDSVTNAPAPPPQDSGKTQQTVATTGSSSDSVTNAPAKKQPPP